MSVSYKSIVVGLCLIGFGPSVLAEEPKSSPAPAAKAAPPMPAKLSEEQKDQMARQRMEHMLAMDDLMQKIRDTKDEAEKARLKEDLLKMIKAHWEEMREHRQLLKEERMQQRMEHRDKMRSQSKPGDKAE
jgi:hypothetical protein